MLSTYDKNTDTLIFQFNGAQVTDSDEIAPGIIADYDESGNIVSLEILDASKHTDDPTHLKFTVEG